MADVVYFSPVTTEYVEQVIKQEKPDAIALGFGGQTALNTGVELENLGIFKKYGVRVLGTQVEAIEKTEDRELFNAALAEIGAKFAQSQACTTVDQVMDAAKEIGLPVMIRSAYALGGLGSGICSTEDELREMATKALATAPQVLVE